MNYCSMMEGMHTNNSKHTATPPWALRWDLSSNWRHFLSFFIIVTENNVATTLKFMVDGTWSLLFFLDMTANIVPKYGDGRLPGVERWWGKGIKHDNKRWLFGQFTRNIHPEHRRVERCKCAIDHLRWWLGSCAQESSLFRFHETA